MINSYALPFPAFFFQKDCKSCTGIKNGSVFLPDCVAKRDLSEAATYQLQYSKLKMLEFFELTTWAELKHIFTTAREEITNES